MRVHHAQRLGIDRLVIDGGLGVARRQELVLNLPEHAKTPLHPPILDLAGRLQIGDRGVGVLHHERGIRHPEEARPDARTIDGDAMRQVEIREPLAQLHGAVGAESGMHDRRIGGITGVHQVGAPVMIPLLRVEGAEDRQVMHLLGHFGQMLGDLHPGRRGVDRLEGPRFSRYRA